MTRKTTFGGDEARLLTLAEAVADGSAVDWADAESSAGSRRQRGFIRNLRTLAGLAEFHWRTDPVAPSPSPALTAWGPLEIRGEVGSGTFGTVYRAWESRLERAVALKVLHDERPAADAALVINEGSLLARVRHPNVVTIFGADCVGGRVGLWMEFVHGRTLKEIHQKQGPFSAQEAIVIGLDLCGALAAVHKAGFLHCDVKAQNVMREAGGRIVLMDFGAAAVASAGRNAAAAAGTPLYLAPEVIAGERPTVQSDLYSLGVLIYYLVSGEFPVIGSSLAEVRHAHQQKGRAFLRDVRPDLPAAFVRLIDDATAVAPAHRPQTAGEFEFLLETATGRSRPRETAQASAPSVGGTSVRDSELWRSIAVVPFVDMSADKKLDYLCEGIAEEIVSALTKVSGLRVIASTSAVHFKRSAQDARRLETASAGTVLDGSALV